MRCDEPLTGLGTPDVRIESGRSDSRSHGFWCCMHVYDVLGFVRVTSIEILATRRPPRLVADGDCNVRATVLNTMLAF